MAHLGSRIAQSLISLLCYNVVATKHFKSSQGGHATMSPKIRTIRGQLFSMPPIFWHMLPPLPNMLTGNNFAPHPLIFNSVRRRKFACGWLVLRHGRPRPTCVKQLIPELWQSSQVVLGLAVQQRLLTDTAPPGRQVGGHLLTDGPRIEEQIGDVLMALFDLVNSREVSLHDHVPDRLVWPAQQRLAVDETLFQEHS